MDDQAYAELKDRVFAAIWDELAPLEPRHRTDEFAGRSAGRSAG